MSVYKIRRDLAAAGDIYLGSSGDVGLTRTASGLKVFGAGGPATAGTIDGLALTGGTLNMQDGRVRIGTAAGALGTTSTLPADVPGLIRVGVSGGTPQLGFVVNGTSYVLSAALAGTGAVSMFANPAGS